MKLTDENQDGMDCRPPTGRDTGISVPPCLQKFLDEAVARRAAAMKRPLQPAERPDSVNV